MILEAFTNCYSLQVPEVLKRFMPEEFQDEIPFVKPAPIEEEAKAAAAKKAGKK